MPSQCERPDTRNMDRTQKRRGVSAPRVLITGAVLSAALCWLSLYAYMVAKSAAFAMEYCMPGAVLLLFLLAGVVNPVLKLLDRKLGVCRLAFSASELVIIFMMLALVSGLVSMGFVENLLPIITGGAYYGNDANHWREAVHFHSPTWMFVTDAETVKCFYESVPRDMPAPWRPWILPLSAWTLFAMAYFAASVALMVIFRRQWVDNERLVYPIAQVPTAFVDENQKTLTPAMMRSRLMWGGAAISMLVASINCLHRISPNMPYIRLDGNMVLWEKLLICRMHFSFVVAGFSYLLNTSVSLSLWLFYFVAKLQTAVFKHIGFSIGRRDPFSSCPPSVSYQAAGAMLVFVAIGIWVARKHLLRVLRCAFSRARPGQTREDADEIMSYLQAVVLFVVGVAIMFVWLLLTGMNIWTVVVFLAFAFGVILFLARAIAQAGIAAARPVLIPQVMTVHALGTEAIGAAGLASLAYSFSWAADVRTSVMAAAANSLKMLSGKRPTRFVAQAAVWLALLLGLVVSYVAMISICYKHGGITASPWFMQGMPKYVCKYAHTLIHDRVEVGAARWIFTGIGGLAMVLLTLARSRLLWWPLHPVGLALGATSPVQWSWTGIFVAWLVKSLVLRYGGVRLYRKTRDVAIGLVIGQFLAAGIWTAIAVLTKTPGLRVPIL